jgi:hypothetical protein
MRILAAERVQMAGIMWRVKIKRPLSSLIRDFPESCLGKERSEEEEDREGEGRKEMEWKRKRKRGSREIRRIGRGRCERREGAGE